MASGLNSRIKNRFTSSSTSFPLRSPMLSYSFDSSGLIFYAVLLLGLQMRQSWERYSDSCIHFIICPYSLIHAFGSGAGNASTCTDWQRVSYPTPTYQQHMDRRVVRRPCHNSGGEGPCTSGRSPIIDDWAVRVHVKGVWKHALNFGGASFAGKRMTWVYLTSPNAVHVHKLSVYIRASSKIFQV